MTEATWGVAPPPLTSGGAGIWEDRIQTAIDTSREESKKKSPDLESVWGRFGPYSNYSVTRSVKSAIEKVVGSYISSDWDITTRTEEDSIYVYLRYKGE